MMNKNIRGITLIALVITIIVLLILAGVSIAMLTGDNGILIQATEARNKNTQATEIEQIQLAWQALHLEDLKDGKQDGIQANDLYQQLLSDGADVKSVIVDDATGDLIVEFNSGNKYRVDNNGNVTFEGTDTTPSTGGEWNGKLNTPDLKTGMTAVKWNGTEWVDTNANDPEWYNYDNQNWANAKTKDGSMWVWIPRYEYKIEGETVSVKFIPTNQTTPDGDYQYVHPAFRDGRATKFVNGEWREEIAGFWVAKYEAGYQANTTDVANAEQIINGSDEVKYSDKNYTSGEYSTNALGQDLTNYNSQKISYPVFNALTYSYNNISIGDSYTISREIEKASDFYGLNESQVDSHMMKNSEWGAVAYLTQSSIGRNGQKVTINSKNLNNYNNKYTYAITGYEENAANGVGASSTNNMTGIFDLSGGTWERTAGYITNGNSNLSRNGSSFVYATKDENGYLERSTEYTTVYPFNSSNDSSSNNYDQYKSLKSETYGYGDAILETSTSGSGSTSWHGDYSYFANTDYPFFVRGGGTIMGSLGSIGFYATIGNSSYNDGFRAVLVGSNT